MPRPPFSTVKLRQEEATTLEGVALLVLGPAGAFHYPLPRSGQLVIGRDRDCDVPLDDTTVSRRHAQLRVGSNLEVIDLGSSNGTRVGELELRPNEPVVLSPGAAIHIGKTVLVLQNTTAGDDLREREGDLRNGPPAQVEADLRLIERLVPAFGRIAAGAIHVLILGETGVGKEVLARALHQRSPRAGAPLVCLNCCALSETLLESELFGHERGAFTGAVQAKVGLLEAAHGGTLFLDEVGDMPPTIQAKLLRVLEQKEVLRVGSIKPRPIDVRFVSATNRDLEADVAAGRFRQDLYFRLNGATIVLPPLRERVEEIAPLAAAFVARACEAASRKAVPRIADDALRLLEAYPWPGNIRELRNVVERAVLLCPGATIGLDQLPTEKMMAHLPVRTRIRTISTPTLTLRPAPVGGPTSEVPHETQRLSGKDLDAFFPSKEEEKSRIIAALRQCQGNQTQAAKLLGISRRTMVSRVAEFALPRPRRKSGE